MQDKIVYRLELTNEEYEFIENLRKELYDKLSKMSESELREYFENLLYNSFCKFSKILYSSFVSSNL